MGGIVPQRIQRMRTKGWRMPAGALYVGRGTVWGNPWVVGSNVAIQNGDARQDIYSLDPTRSGFGGDCCGARRISQSLRTGPRRELRAL